MSIVLEEIDRYVNNPDELYPWLEELQLINYTKRLCTQCRYDKYMKVEHYNRYADNICIRCSMCRYRESIRTGSILEKSNLPIKQQLQILSFFIDNITITQVHELLLVDEDTISALYKLYRTKIMVYLEKNPIKFKRNEVVEIDEANIKALNRVKYMM